MSVCLEIYKLQPSMYCDILNWLLDESIPFEYTAIWEDDTHDKFEYIRMIEIEEQDAVALRLKFGL
jgi:hypothetical protein